MSKSFYENKKNIKERTKEEELMRNSHGRRRVTSLFWEWRTTSGEDPIYTLEENDIITEDGKRILSAYKIYMSYDDPTEYEQAMELVGSWSHWQLLLANKKIADTVAKWREELEIRTRSKAIKCMIKSAIEDGAKGSNAAKYVAEAGWRKGANAGPGRPSNKQKKMDRYIDDGVGREIANDLKQLRIAGD